MTLSKIYGLIGYPVKHSLSPAMHNAAFKELNINAEYRLFPLKEEEIPDFMRNLSKNNIYGLNVTIPYKEKILKFVELEGKSFILKRIGTVNTIVRKDDRLIGFNTDIPGFARDIKEKSNPSNINNFFTNKKVAVLGAGGAARAVVYALVEYCGIKDIVIFDIDQVKKNNVVKMIKELFPDFKVKIYGVDSIEQLNLKDKDLFINAAPVGMKQTDTCLVDGGLIHKDLFIYDLIYNPEETMLLKTAKSKGAKASNGLGMLLYQGVLAFEIWTGRKAPVDIMRQVLLNELRKY